MAYKEYKYGSYKVETKALLRKRLSLLAKIRYHEVKGRELQEEFKKLEQEIEEKLKTMNGGVIK